MTLARLIAALFVGLTAFTAFGSAYAKDPVYTGRFNNNAVDGHDVVAYFTDGKPIEGSDQYTHEYMGALWKFSSAANRDAFIAEPEKYAPQFGGYCAWAASQGYTARGNPNNWTIVDGKLYLNYNTSIQRKWEKDIPGFIAKAEENWPGILDK